MTSNAPTLADIFRNFQLQEVGSVSSVQNEQGHVLGSAITTPSPVIETIFICHSDVWIFLWEKLNMNSAYNNISRHFNGEEIITLKSVWQYMNADDDLMGALLFDSGLRDGHHTGGVTTWRTFDNILPSYFDKTTIQIAGKNACKFQIINDKIDIWNAGRQITDVLEMKKLLICILPFNFKGKASLYGKIIQHYEEFPDSLFV